MDFTNDLDTLDNSYYCFVNVLAAQSDARCRDSGCEARAIAQDANCDSADPLGTDTRCLRSHESEGHRFVPTLECRAIRSCDLSILLVSASLPLH